MEYMQAVLAVKLSIHEHAWIPPAIRIDTMLKANAGIWVDRLMRD